MSSLRAFILLIPPSHITSRPDSRTVTNNTNTTTYYVKQNVSTPLNARLWSTISKSAPSAWGPKRKIQITRGLKRTVLRNVSLFNFSSFEQEFFFGWGSLWWRRKKEESSKGETPGDGIVHKNKTPILPPKSLVILILPQLQNKNKNKKLADSNFLLSTMTVFHLSHCAAQCAAPKLFKLLKWVCPSKSLLIPPKTFTARVE